MGTARHLHYLEKCTNVETESDLPRWLVGGSREARDDGAVETTQARLGCLGVNRALPT